MGYQIIAENLSMTTFCCDLLAMPRGLGAHAKMVKDTIKIWLSMVPTIIFVCGFGMFATKMIS